MLWREQRLCGDFSIWRNHARDSIILESVCVRNCCPRADHNITSGSRGDEFFCGFITAMNCGDKIAIVFPFLFPEKGAGFVDLSDC